MKEKKTVVFWFDGPNRSWKWTQIALIKQAFESHWIPALVVRWDWTRTAKGTHLWDPVSKWWEENNPKLKWEESSPELWEEAAHRLAREVVIFKERTLPLLINKYNSELWVLLLDRSLISRTMIPIQYELTHLLYWNHEWEKVNIHEVKPEILFCLDVKRENLLDRLDESDPKFSFRKELIELNSDKYIHHIELLPESIQNIIKVIDGNRSILDVNKDISTYIYRHLKTKYKIHLPFLLK